MEEDNEKIAKALGFVAKVCLEAYCKGSNYLLTGAMSFKATNWK